MKLMARTIAIAALLVGGAPVAAQAPTDTAGNAGMDSVDPEALAMLDKMAANLRSLKQFRVRSEATRETVFDNGQKLQFLEAATYDVAAPDRMQVEVRSDARTWRAYYDGKQMTVYEPARNAYVTFPATGTVSEVVLAADTQLGLKMPLLDLFMWGTPAASDHKPKSGMRIGTSRVGDEVVGHYAFRDDALDYELWVTEGDNPLPRKMVITTKTNPALPQYSAHYFWTLNPPPPAGGYTFTPGPNDRLVDYGTAKLAAAAAAAK
jgi:hypothetical protein